MLAVFVPPDPLSTLLDTALGREAGFRDSINGFRCLQLPVGLRQWESPASGHWGREDPEERMLLLHLPLSKELDWIGLAMAALLYQRLPSRSASKYGDVMYPGSYKPQSVLPFFAFTLQLCP